MLKMEEEIPRRDWYSVPEAADLLSICRSTLHRWILEGRILDGKFWKMGKNYRLNQHYIDNVYSGKTDILPRKRRVYVHSGNGGTRDLQNAD